MYVCGDLGAICMEKVVHIMALPKSGKKEVCTASGVGWTVPIEQGNSSA